jgi:hypothetical protein
MMMEHLPTQWQALCDEARDLLTANIEKLHRMTPVDEVQEYLRDWSIVLGVLSRDVLDSTSMLLNAGRLRGANMVSRPFADYAIVLRYYVVQAMEVAQESPGAPVDGKQIHAVADWNNADLRMGRLLSIYDPSTWPPEVRAKLEETLASRERAPERKFSQMVEYLAQNEVRVRHLIDRYIWDAEYRYNNIRANWRMQSAFLHGDQIIITDVIEFNDQGKRTGNINWNGNGDARTILFTGLLELCHFLASCEEVHGDSSGQAAFYAKTARAFKASNTAAT